jgi:DNA-binding transcriptional LysR family regulator
VQPLGTIHEELYLFASPDDPINALAEEDRLEYLNHADFASFAAGMRSRELVDRWAERIGVTLNVVVESRTIETMRAYVVRGLAVAVLPQFSAVEDVRTGQAVMVPLRGLPLTRSAVVLARPELAASYEVRLFLDMLPVPVGAEPWTELGHSAAG